MWRPRRSRRRRAPAPCREDIEARPGPGGAVSGPSVSGTSVSGTSVWRVHEGEMLRGVLARWGARVGTEVLFLTDRRLPAGRGRGLRGRVHGRGPGAVPEPVASPACAGGRAIGRRGGTRREAPDACVAGKGRNAMKTRRDGVRSALAGTPLLMASLALAAVLGAAPPGGARAGSEADLRSEDLGAEALRAEALVSALRANGAEIVTPGLPRRAGWLSGGAVRGCRLQPVRHGRRPRRRRSALRA